MAVSTPGMVDYGEDGFVVRFKYDPIAVAEIKSLQRRRWLKLRREWIVEAHGPSVTGLLRVARARNWQVTEEAGRAVRRLLEQEATVEYTVDVVHGCYGEPWFICKLGNDDELPKQIATIPGAYIDGDEWWVPAYQADCCAPLLDLVGSDDRFLVSEGAWRLLEEPDESYPELQHAVQPCASTPDTGRAEPSSRSSPGAWQPDAQGYHMHRLSSATREDGFEVAPSLRGELLPFQVAGVRYICEAKRAFLADEMGLGKSVQALAAIETADAYPALIICPATLKSNWEREARKWLPESRSIATLDRPQESVPAVDILITTYETLTRSVEHLNQQGFNSIVADESHFIKNRDAQRTQAAIAVAATVPTLRLCLTGTPVPNQPIELAAQLHFLGLLDQEFGGFWPFANRYCAPKRDDFGLRFGAANLDELANRLRSRCYCRREKSMVLPQLPGKSRTDVWIDLEQRHEYERVELKNRERLRALATRDHEDASASAEHAARAEARRRSQLGCIQNILHECGRQKVAGIVHWIRSFVVREEPLVVFAHHRDVIATLKAHFPDALCITGADKPAQRDRAAQAFQAGESTLVICSTQVAGIGITLTRAAHVAFAEIGWSAAAHDQAEDRIHRIGQNRAATVWYLLAEDTIDSLILDVIERKRSMAGQLNASALLELGNALVQMTGGSRRGQPGSKADEHAV